MTWEWPGVLLEGKPVSPPRTPEQETWPTLRKGLFLFSLKKVPSNCISGKEVTTL